MSTGRALNGRRRAVRRRRRCRCVAAPPRAAAAVCLPVATIAACLARFRVVQVACTTEDWVGVFLRSVEGPQTPVNPAACCPLLRGPTARARPRSSRRAQCAFRPQAVSIRQHTQPITTFRVCDHSCELLVGVSEPNDRRRAGWCEFSLGGSPRPRLFVLSLSRFRPVHQAMFKSPAYSPFVEIHKV